MKKIIPVLIFLLYWFLFPVNIKKEFVPVLLNSADVQQDITARSGDEPMLAFSGPSVSGYINEAGRVIFSLESDGYVHAAAGYCISADNTGSFRLVGLDGKTVSSFSADGMPYFAETGFYLISHDARGFSVFTKAGQPVWNRYFSVPITVFSASTSITVIGLTSGDLFILDNSGNIVYEKRLDYPDVDCIYALAVSPDNRKIAVIHGNSPQFLHVLEKTGEKGHDYRDILVNELNTGFRNDVFLVFSADSSSLAYKTHQGAAFYSFKKKSSSLIDIDGNLDTGVLSGNGSFFFFSVEKYGKRKFYYTDLKSGEQYSGSRSFDYISFDINQNRLLVFTSDIVDPEYHDENLKAVYSNKVFLYGLEKK